MPRPREKRRIKFLPKAKYFKPQSIPLSSLKVIELNHEEMEALRLKNVENINQVECAKEMNTSQSTFQRILTSAEQKVSLALVEGCAIRIYEDD
ncbi:DUF134 domain-containing protein [Candidatus Peregrinibacteria bacterium]|mgnify:FL=1|jgi:predicted DNA-binding protein (UPF0251 family)|nr:DUF134 domain-containing protein [Candidatus Peregrinibacteria bacterium]MBT3598480.1 DUF134 domain-containing protein [Candidatus Peregrinibacteria bacterium]MBT4366995.1 DUF134 domain-containing protein [Candidatus Peregrinibacteria bacterium]MBT4586010.1 DUF134 domain-containing protein [Candidatus Peregrinibacteria bacterium]MBT6730851.1 DUF134 domain-containing protein [Candidatus Peregrinibacteria bacterium]